MAFATLTNAWTSWILSNRSGLKPSGTIGTALVSDLLVGDYEFGSRALVSALGTTTAGVRTLTMSRLGQTFIVNWTATSTVLIIR
jgi:hypothetical protein